MGGTISFNFSVSAPSAPAITASFSLGTVSPTSLAAGGAITLSGLTVTAGASTYWRLQLAVRDTRTGSNVASFDTTSGQGTQEMILTSAGIASGVSTGDGLSIVGTLTFASNSSLTQQVSTQAINSGTVASVSGTSSYSGMSATCQTLWQDYNSLYQQQLSLRLEAARLYPSGNLPTALADEIRNLGGELDQIIVEYGANGCTATLPT